MDSSSGTKKSVVVLEYDGRYLPHPVVVFGVTAYVSIATIWLFVSHVYLVLALTTSWAIAKRVGWQTVHTTSMDLSSRFRLNFGRSVRWLKDRAFRSP